MFSLAESVRALSLSSLGKAIIAMAFVFGTFFRFALLAWLAELGDKTWWLTVAFIVWCPFNGLRYNIAKFYGLECTLVLCASISMLTVRTILLACGLNPFQWDGFCNVTAFLILLVCSLVCSVQWKRSLDAQYDPEQAGSQLVQSSKTNSDALAESGGSVGVGPEESTTLYGSYGTLTAPKDNWSLARIVIFTFILPGATVLFAEAMDRSQGILIDVDHKRADLAFGAPIGFALSELFAGGFGYVTRWFLSGHPQHGVTETRLLFFLMLIFWLVTVCCLRDAVTRLVLGELPSSTLRHA